VLFSALYSAFRVLLALVVIRGRGEAAKDAHFSFFATRWRCCADRSVVLGWSRRTVSF
jgi:hypothetical protein